MITALLKIAGLVLGILDRYLEEQHRLKGEKENERFERALADNDLELVADRLSKRLRRFKDNHPEG
jgi:hypothetical protein